MGGDHKCPVCQATFTRPQHVARHMRSHTGDRPYKCQYCGDQFARSDLLSRHVNKCHAGEKPSSGAPATGRRKGSASATRATTSKQACDQCVQSSLPCDGSNPCAKCIQRKCRCTYIKFHRQTAPIGPGHNPRPQVNSVSSRLPGFASPDDFLLNPAPPIPSITPIPGDPSVLPPSYNHPSSSSAFTFPQMYSSTADSSLPMMSDGEYAKYRGQTDYLRRQTLPFPSGPGVPPPSSSTSLGFDGRPSSATSWLGWGPDTTSQLAAGGRPPPPPHHLVDEPKSDYPHVNSNVHGQPSFTYPPVAADPYLGAYANRRLPQDRRPSVDFSSDSSTEHSMPSSAASSSVHLPLVDAQQQHQQQQQQHQQQQQQQQQQAYHDAQAQAHASFLQSRTEEGGRSSGSPASGEGLPAGAVSGGAGGGVGVAGGGGGIGGGQGEGGFSSAFGLMSLDDPAILAGLSTDSAPFFTNNGMDMYPGDPDATPMPPKASSHHSQGKGMGVGSFGVGGSVLPPIAASSSGLTPLLSLSNSGGGSGLGGGGGGGGGGRDRDAETRELKEFWKQYLRTPLSGTGSTPGGLGPISPGSGGGNGGYRRARVSSLPSAQTPPVERASFGYGLNVNNPHPNSSNNPHHNLNANANANANGTSSMRTTLHGNPEDLRSYEAAVLARRAPLNLNLNLVPKRARGATTTSISGGEGEGGGGGQQSHPHQQSHQHPQSHQHQQSHPHPPSHQHPHPHAAGSSDDNSRPGSSSSSSLAQAQAYAFGQAIQHHRSQQPPFAYAIQTQTQTQTHSHSQSHSHSHSQSHSHSGETPPSRGSTASLDESESDGFSVGGGGGGGGERHAHNHHPSHQRDWDSDIDIGIDGSGGGGGALRPSFKRLPSQTLGPTNTKRAMLEYDGEDEGDVSEEGLEGGGLHPPSLHSAHQHRSSHSHQQGYLPPPSNMGVGMMAPPPPSAMPSGSLANRRSLRTRRMSAPDTSPTVPSFAAAGQL